MSRAFFLFAISVILMSLSITQQLFGQEKSGDKTSVTSKAELIDSFGNSTGEEGSARIDALRNSMQNMPNSKGLFIVYCGKTCKNGEVEAHLRGIGISLRGKGWKSKDYITLNGGFKDKLTVEFWLIPENSCPPMPTSTVDIKDVKFKGNDKRKFVAYDCCEY